MTAKQKANRERFKKVVAEAKKLRAKNPKLTQPQAVKQAWAILYKGGKVSGYEKTIRKGNLTSVVYSKTTKKKSAKKVTQGKLFGTTRPTKVKAKKSKKTGEMHTDTKSHNVNIRVVSGVGKNFKNYISYRKHIIDIEISQSGKKWYVAHSGYINIPFYTGELKTAKNYIDRAILMNKK